MASQQPRMGGRFMKKSEIERREKARAQVEDVNLKRKSVCADQNVCSDVVGRRIVDISMLAEMLWCCDCDKPISLRDILSERQCGLASIFSVKCRDCLLVVKVYTSSHAVDASDESTLYAVNYKAVLGCLNSGVGADNLNSVLASLNVPPLSRPTFNRAQQRVSKALKECAQESCERAVIDEKQLTLAAKRTHDDPEQPDTVQMRATQKRRKLDQS